jgi:hypothetical protein
MLISSVYYDGNLEYLISEGTCLNNSVTLLSIEQW